MLGRPWKMWRKRSPWATFSIFDPGSVMAMKRLPALSAPIVCFHSLEEILFEDIGLEGRTRLARNHEQCLCQINFIFEGLDLRGIGGVEHVQLREACNFSVGHAQDFGTQARSAHAEQQDVREALRFCFFGKIAKCFGVRDLLFGYA